SFGSLARSRDGPAIGRTFPQAGWPPSCSSDGTIESLLLVDQALTAPALIIRSAGFHSPLRLRRQTEMAPFREARARRHGEGPLNQFLTNAARRSARGICRRAGRRRLGDGFSGALPGSRW